MSRLFVGPRERNFMSDIVKEYVKDICGQKLYYYPISEIKSNIHPIYNESIDKIFDNPIRIDALVGSPEIETHITEFGPDQNYTLEVWLQYRDMVDKEINVCIGDFFSYGDVMYEITEMNTTRNIYGAAEEKDGYKIKGSKAREGLFKERLLGPTDRTLSDSDAIQETFQQQRGFEYNDDGATADKRDLQELGVLEKPLPDSPAEVSPQGALPGDTGGSTFYGDD